jgi:hypothetical protein
MFGQQRGGVNSSVAQTRAGPAGSRMEIVKDRTVDSLTSFLEAVVKVRDEWARASKSYGDPWFRGHSDARWGLQPTLYRYDLKHLEQAIRRGFRRLGTQYVSNEQPDEWGWYFLMQHFRAPTRLLDWTDGALIALFFAVAPSIPNQSEVKTNAAVWMLDPWWLNRATARRDTILLPEEPVAKPYLPRLLAGERTLKPRLPIAIAPPHMVRRIAAQRSRFTIFGTDPEGLNYTANRPRSRLMKFVIRQDAIWRIRLDLTTAGITEGTVFPDLEGVSRELIRTWLEPWEIAKGVWQK